MKATHLVVTTRDSYRVELTDKEVRGIWVDLVTTGQDTTLVIKALTYDKTRTVFINPRHLVSIEEIEE